MRDVAHRRHVLRFCAHHTRPAARAAADASNPPTPPRRVPLEESAAASAAGPWSSHLEPRLRWLRAKLVRVSAENPHRLGATLQLSIAERWLERVREDEPRGIAISAIAAVTAEREFGSAAVYLEAAAAWDRHVLGRQDR